MTKINKKLVRTIDSKDVNRIIMEEANRQAMDAFTRGLIGELKLIFPKNFPKAIVVAIAIEGIDIKLIGAVSDRKNFV